MFAVVSAWLVWLAVVGYCWLRARQCGRRLRRLEAEVTRLGGLVDGDPLPVGRPALLELGPARTGLAVQGRHA